MKVGEAATFQSVRLIASEAAKGSSSKARNPISQGVTRTRPRQRRQRRRARVRAPTAGAAAVGGRLDATIDSSLRAAPYLTFASTLSPASIALASASRGGVSPLNALSSWER